MAMPAAGGEKPTIEQIAAELNISKTTVSRAISGKGRVSGATRTRVLEAMGRAGYDAGALRQGAANGVTNNLTLVIPKHFVRLDLPFLRKCMGGVCSMAMQRGYDLLLCYVGDSDLRQLERQLANHKVDGVILSRTMLQDPSVDLLRRYGVPFVAIGRIDDPEVLQADNDQVGAAAEMTRLLLQRGMRRIAYLGGSTNYTVNVDRLHGFLRAMGEFGIPQEQTMVWTGIESSAARIDALESALSHYPECILCCDDQLAYDVLQELRQRSIRVPEQIRLASLFDSELLASVVPSVSAAQFDSERLGATACRMLLDHMAGRDVQNHQVQGYQVILRDSTK